MLVDPGPLPENLPQTMVIAGDVPLGMGRLFGGMETPHDGTVAVAETVVRGAADHCVIHGNHFGMLFMKEVSRLIAEFLREGRFMSRPRG